MGALDYQFGAKKESTFNVPVTVDRFFEYKDNPAAIVGVPGTTMSNPLRVGSRVRRSDRQVRYFDHAEGTVSLDVMNKGFGFWLEHMLGGIATTGSGPYTHTATVGSLLSKSFTAQLNLPYKGGTNQAYTYAGGKVLSWNLASAVGDFLSVELSTWFASQTDATALASASYPSSMRAFNWQQGTVSIGGVEVDVDSISINVDLNCNVDRSKKIGDTRTAPTYGNELAIGFEIECDWASNTQWDRVFAAAAGDELAEIEVVFDNGTDSLTVTIPAASFDNIDMGGDPGTPVQTLSGVGLYDGSNSPITLVLVNGDATP